MIDFITEFVLLFVYIAYRDSAYNICIFTCNSLGVQVHALFDYTHLNVD